MYKLRKNTGNPNLILNFTRASKVHQITQTTSSEPPTPHFQHFLSLLGEIVIVKNR